MTPLSSYVFPCHSPFQTIGLPSFQSETTFVPNIYCLIVSGFTSASQTLAIGALMPISAFAIKPWLIKPIVTFHFGCFIPPDEPPVELASPFSTNQIKIGDSEDVVVDVCARDWAFPKPGPSVDLNWALPKPDPLVDFKPFQVGPNDGLKFRRRFTNLGSMLPCPEIGQLVVVRKL